jgi:hypothetical protein
MIVEKQMECRLAGETEVLGEILPQRHFRPSQNPTWPDPGLNPGRRGEKPVTNRLSYGAADTRLTTADCESGKWQTRRLVRESAPLQKACNRQRQYKWCGHKPQICALFQDKLAEWPSVVI